VCVCVCVCVCACVCVCECVHTHTSTHTFIYTYTYTYIKGAWIKEGAVLMYIGLCVCVYVRVCVCVYMRVYLYMQIHIWRERVSKLPCSHRCWCASVCACVCVGVCVPQESTRHKTYTRTHAHTHTHTNIDKNSVFFDTPALQIFICISVCVCVGVFRRNQRGARRLGKGIRMCCDITCVFLSVHNLSPPHALLSHHDELWHHNTCECPFRWSIHVCALWFIHLVRFILCKGICMCCDVTTHHVVTWVHVGERDHTHSKTHK